MYVWEGGNILSCTVQNTVAPIGTTPYAPPVHMSEILWWYREHQKACSAVGANVLKRSLYDHDIDRTIIST